MGLLRLFKKKINSKEVVMRVVNKTLFVKTMMFVFGALLSALSFNLFCVQNNFVLGGLGGIAIILNKLFEIDSTLVILVGNVIFVIISIFTIGAKKSLLSIVGAMVYTAFVYFTSDFPAMINFHFDNILLYVLAAGLVGGFGEGLVYKSGFNTGGTDIVNLIINRYVGFSIGKSMFVSDGLIVLCGVFVFGIVNSMYAGIVLFLLSKLSDRVILGIGKTKAFYIITDEPDKVKEFIVNKLGHGITELNAKGGFKKETQKLLLTVIPTQEYYLIKSELNKIDKSAFFVVVDAFESRGGV